MKAMCTKDTLKLVRTVFLAAIAISTVAFAAVAAWAAAVAALSVRSRRMTRFSLLSFLVPGDVSSLVFMAFASSDLVGYACTIH